MQKAEVERCGLCRQKRHHPRSGSGEEQFWFWERWVAETGSFCGKIGVERPDEAIALSAEPQRGEAEVKVIVSKYRVF